MKRILTLAASLLLLAGFTATAQDNQTPEYGYKQTGFASTPKFGGYIIGGYKYSDLDGANGGPVSTADSSVSMWTAASSTISSTASSSR